MVVSLFGSIKMMMNKLLGNNMVSMVTNLLYIKRRIKNKLFGNNMVTNLLSIKVLKPTRLCDIETKLIKLHDKYLSLISIQFKFKKYS